MTWTLPSWLTTDVTKTCADCGSLAVIQVVVGLKRDVAKGRETPILAYQCQAVKDGVRCKGPALAQGKKVA